MMIRVAIIVSAICCGLTAFSDDAQVRAVQLDLARQKESPVFVTNYMGRVRAAGCNAVVLHLEPASAAKP